MRKQMFALHFKTKKNIYILDTKSSEIFPITEIQKEILENYFDKSREELERSSDFKDVKGLNFQQEYNYIKFLIEKGYFYGDPNNVIPEYCKDKDDSLTSQLILVLTEQCNFRCKYCIYSDKYFKSSNYTENDMTFELAIKSVEYYLRLHKDKIKHGLNDNLKISFYGGEPLLKFDLIKEVVRYIDKIGEKADFYITTNGVLLTDEIAEFLVDNEFNVKFSLDGDQKNHDRNRVTISGNVTHDIIMNNIKKYLRIKREVGNKDILNSFNCCFDYETDMLKCVNFFADNYSEFSPSFIIYSMIDPYNTSYYNDHTEVPENTVLVKSLKKIKEKFFSKDSSIEFRNSSYILFNNIFSIYARNKNISSSFKNTCIPYSKLAVFPDGVIALCEKSGKRFPIGNMYKEGINDKDVEKIVYLFFANYVNGKCKYCPYQNLCQACYIQMDDDGMINEHYCRDQKENIDKSLCALYTILEESPEMLDLVDLSRAHNKTAQI